jgi:hypothetical protein
MWLTITRATRPALISRPMPRPGLAVSLAITVRFFLALAHEFGHQPMRCAHAHETADHQHRPIGDAGDGILPP